MSSGWSGFMKKSQKHQLKKAKSKPNSRKRKSNPSSNSKENNATQPSSKRRRISNIECVQCPICDKKLLANLINFHIEEHFIQTQQKENHNNLNNNNHNHNKQNQSDTTNSSQEHSMNSSANISSETNILCTNHCNENTNNSLQSSNTSTATSTTPTTPPQSPLKLPSKPSTPQSQKNKAAKICPLFTSGALPSSMFTKGKKRTPSSTIPAQEAVFYVGINTDNDDEHIMSWNSEWIDSSSEEIKSFLSRSKEMDYFITSVMIKEPNTVGPTKVHLVCNYPSSNGPIEIIGNDFRFNYPSPNNWRFSPSLTKSLLQKAVRVSYHDSAMKCGYLLILKDSLQSLLRRLSIIVIEDVILMSDYILLIWLLLTESKSNINEKYHPSICWYNWLFSLIKKCAMYNIRDYMDFDLHPSPDQYINLFTPLKMQQEKKDNEDNEDNQNKQEKVEEIDENIGMKQLFIRCILMRAAYGGMKCDVAMLRSYACIWHNRFFGQTSYCNYYEQRLSKLFINDEIKELLFDEDNVNRDRDRVEFALMVENNDWLSFINKFEGYYWNACSQQEMKNIISLCDNDLILSGVDFHCSNMLSVLCNNGNGQCWKILNQYVDTEMNVNNNILFYTKWKNNIEGLLKFIVWEFRSSTTDKVSLIMDENKPNELFDLYQQIKPYLKDYSLKHLKSRKAF